MNRSQYNQKRQLIISKNRSRRMRGLEPLEVPAALPVIYGWEIYDQSGCYMHYELDESEVNQLRTQGCKVKRTPYLYAGRMPVEKN